MAACGTDGFAPVRPLTVTRELQATSLGYEDSGWVLVRRAHDSERADVVEQAKGDK